MPVCKKYGWEAVQRGTQACQSTIIQIETGANSMAICDKVHTNHNISVSAWTAGKASWYQEDHSFEPFGIVHTVEAYLF